jgi:hypothetical protein
MIASLLGLILDILNEGTVQILLRGVLENACKLLKNFQAGGTLQINQPTSLLGLVVLVEANLLEGLHYLTSTIVDAMGLAQKRNDDISIRRLVEDDFRVAGCYDLAAIPGGGIRQLPIDLALTENLKVGVGLVR